MGGPSRSKRRGRRRRLSAPGSAPGLLVVDSAAPPTVLRRIEYGPAHFDDRILVDLAALEHQPPEGARTWIDVQGLGDEPTLRAVAERFAIHTLVMEDVVSGHQRPKLEAYDDQLFLITRLPVPGGGQSEQVGFVLAPGVVVSFRERPSPLFEPVVGRMERAGSRLRERGSDYLLYALLDIAVDAHFPQLEQIELQLDALEERALAGDGQALFRELHDLRQRVGALRREALPLRDVVASLGRGLDELVSERTRVFLRDCHDHAVQVVDALEAARERASGLMDLALAISGERMNEIMKVLTVVASLFIPLTFVAGLYGMNFDPAASPWNMPELSHPYGYPIVLGVMALLALGMVIAFRRMGWLGRSGRSRSAPDDQDSR